MGNIKTMRKKIISSISSVIAVVLIALVGYYVYCSMSGKIAFIGNSAVIRIVTPSMEPTIPTGKYICVKKLKDKDISSLKAGDIISFYSNDPQIYRKLNTHRIVEVIKDGNETRFVTKGDNNQVNDNLTTSADDVVAKYVSSSTFATKIADFLSKKTVFLLLIVLPSLFLVVLCIRDIVKKSKEIKMDLLVKEEVEKMKENKNK